MDKIVRVVLRFDQFALDLSRGCLQANGRDIELRPKAFEVLRYLAENAGRLISKQELHQGVWGDVAVSDDSLTQCIHQLRHKLNDGERKLIRTIPRRGYLLDAIVTEGPWTEGHGLTSAEEAPDSPADAYAAGAAPTVSRATRPTRVVVASVLGILLGAYVLAPGLGSPPHAARSFLDTLISQANPSELFTTENARQVARIAELKQLPIPAFQIWKPSLDVPEAARRFIGVWVSGSGWLNSNRQFMLIIARLDKDGVAEGYVVDGPPQPNSFVQDTAKTRPLRARVSGNVLFYTGPHGDYAATLTPQGRIEFRLTFRDGRVGVVALDPLWTLVAAERAERTELVTR